MLDINFIIVGILILLIHVACAEYTKNNDNIGIPSDQEEEKIMIIIKFEDYCSNCDYLEPEVEKIYADCNIHQQVIFCKYRDHCRTIAEHIEKEKKNA